MVWLASDNPFTAQRFHALPYHFEDLDAEILLERLWKNSGRGLLLGAHGHGKTTLLHSLQDQLEKEGHDCVWLGLNRVSRRVPDSLWKGLNRDKVILLDGAEQLNAWQWCNFLLHTRQVKGLLVTSHRPGRLTTLYECKTTEGLLKKLLLDLTPELSEKLQPIAQELYARHQGNLREVWFGLYEFLGADSITAL